MVFTPTGDNGEKNVSEVVEINALFKSVDKKNAPPADVEKLRQYLTKYPLLSQVAGDLAKQVEQEIIARAYPTQKGRALSVEAYCQHLRSEFGYTTASPLERSLIEHVVLCWLRLYVTELRYESRMEENLSLAQGDYWERKLSTHQKRYLRAVETLARIRKLGINIQVNVAGKMVVTG